MPAPPQRFEVRLDLNFLGQQSTERCLCNVKIFQQCGEENKPAGEDAG